MREAGDWKRVLLAQSLLPQTHELRMDAADGERLAVDSITVSERAWATLYGPLAAVLIAASLLLWVVVDALRQRRR